MSNKRRNWVATPTETRIAWIVASATVVLVIGAFLWPQVETREAVTNTVVQEQAEEESIEKIITKVQNSEKHPIQAETKPAPVTKPVSNPVAKADPAPTLKKTAPVISPETTTTPPPVTRSSTPSTARLSAGYYVQTGAFSDRKRAEQLAKKLSSNWKTQIKKKSNNLFAVWSGPYSNSKEATAAKNSIAMRTKIKGFIVKN